MANKLHIDFDKPELRKTNFFSISRTRITFAIIIVLLIFTWMLSDNFGIENQEKVTQSRIYRKIIFEKTILEISKDKKSIYNRNNFSHELNQSLDIRIIKNTYLNLYINKPINIIN